MTESGAVRTRRILGPALLLCAVTAAAWAVFVAVWGGGRFEIWGARVSSRDPVRPLIAAGLFAAVYYWKCREFSREHLRSLAGPRAVGISVVLVAAAVAVLTYALGSRYASGSDSYGYVSQAVRWLNGEVQIVEPLAVSADWENAGWALSPLGYRPAVTDPAANVPTYPPGLPLLMAGVASVAGHCAMFLIVPFAAGITVIATYRLAVLMTDSIVVGAASSLMLATSPAFLFSAMWPMSDVPAAAATVGAAVFVLNGRPLSAGLVSGVGLLIRPNLVLLPVALALFLLSCRTGRDDSVRDRVFRAVLFLGIVGVFAGLVGVLNDRLYGSPFRSGYGDTAELFSWRFWNDNVANYSVWFTETHSPVIWIWPLGALAMGRRGVALSGAIVCAVLLSYLFYRPFDEWWYLRFVLPALPFIYIGFVSAIRYIVQHVRFGSRAVRAAVAATVTLFVMAYSLREAVARSTFDLNDGERRYADVGVFIRDNLAHQAAVIAQQHSGSARYYGGVTTLRYGFLAPGEMNRVIENLKDLGLHPYLLLEDWEIPAFERHFAGLETMQVSAMGASAVYDHGGTRVFLYDLLGSDGRGPASSIPRADARSHCRPVDRVPRPR